MHRQSFRRDVRSPRSSCGFPPPPNARSFLSSGGLATPAVRAAPVRAQRQHSSSVAFYVVCSAQRPIVCLSVLPRAVKHPSYAPHRARFSRWLGFGFLGWRTPDLRSEYNRPTNEWARNFLRVGRRPTDPTRFKKPWPWRTRKTTALPPSERTVARYWPRDLKSWV